MVPPRIEADSMLCGPTATTLLCRPARLGINPAPYFPPNPTMPGRRQAREAALQLLFQRDLQPDVAQETARAMLEETLQNPDLRDFAWQLYVGTFAEQENIDRRIQDVAHNWRLSRMATTDRNILRMGVYELTFAGTPPAVVLDECIEIARTFGNAQSGPFVNGVLDKLIPEGSRPPAPAAEQPS